MRWHRKSWRKREVPVLTRYGRFMSSRTFMSIDRRVRGPLHFEAAVKFRRAGEDWQRLEGRVTQHLDRHDRVVQILIQFDIPDEVKPGGLYVDDS